MSVAPNANPSEVSATLRNTRGVAFAIWWKLCTIVVIGLLAIGFLGGFLGYVFPRGQLEFWLATQVVNLIPSAGSYLFASPTSAQAAMSTMLMVVINGLGAVVLFVLLNWLLARHVGRTIGGYRLVLQRVA